MIDNLMALDQLNGFGSLQDLDAPDVRLKHQEVASLLLVIRMHLHDRRVYLHWRFLDDSLVELVLPDDLLRHLQGFVLAIFLLVPLDYLVDAHLAGLLLFYFEIFNLLFGLDIFLWISTVVEIIL